MFWASIILHLPLAYAVSGVELFSDFQMPNGFSKSSISYSASKKAICLTGHISVTSNATTYQVLVPAPADQYQTTQFFVDLQRPPFDFGAKIIDGSRPTSGTWKIFSKLCIPNRPNAAAAVRTVQVLTHGITLDSSYWDTAPRYSYVDAAAEAGYATFSYDRLGIGHSDHPDPLQVVQAPLQVEILHSLISKLRVANIGGHRFERIVGVGLSSSRRAL